MGAGKTSQAASPVREPSPCDDRRRSDGWAILLVGVAVEHPSGGALHLLSYSTPRISQSAPRVRILSGNRAEAWRGRPAIRPVQETSSIADKG
jgi:hypothetical protein